MFLCRCNDKAAMLIRAAPDTGWNRPAAESIVRGIK